jgi:hypothetical protein
MKKQNRSGFVSSLVIKGSPKQNAAFMRNNKVENRHIHLVVLFIVFMAVSASVSAQATGTINGAAITVPNQTINITVGNVTFSGTGAMNATGTQIQIEYTYDNDTPFIGGNGTCMAIYDKQ